MRWATPFTTYLRSFHRTMSVIKNDSLLAPLAAGEAVFIHLLVRLSDCRKGL